MTMERRGSFFVKPPKRGMPFSTRGLADGWREMDECLWDMSIAGGYIDRSDKRHWVIVPDASSPWGTNLDATNRDTANKIETLDRDSNGFAQIRGARNRNDTGYALDTLQDSVDRIPVYDESEDQIRWGSISLITGTQLDYENTDTLTRIATLDRDTGGFVQLRGARTRSAVGYAITAISDSDLLPIFDESEDQIRWGRVDSFLNQLTVDNHSLENNAGTVQVKHWDLPGGATQPGVVDADLFLLRATDTTDMQYISWQTMVDALNTGLNYLPAYDSKSINVDSTPALQVCGWDSPTTIGSLDTDAMLLVRPVGGTAARYIRWGALAGDSSLWPTLDGISIDYTADTKVEIKGWAGASVDTSLAVNGNDLVLCKKWDTTSSAYDSVAEFVTVDQLKTYITT